MPSKSSASSAPDLFGTPKIAPAEGQAVDPVCGMTVDPATTPHHAHHAGADHHFCAASCRTKFIADPAKYLTPHDQRAPEAPPPGAEGMVYTCPMDPEIRQIGPGACPICGMALEPLAPSLDSGPNPELVDFTKRLWIAAPLTLAVFVLEMGSHLVGAHGWIEPRLNAWLQALLATPVVLWVGWPFLQRGWTSFRTRKLNMFSLIALGVAAAWLASVVATLAPGLFPEARLGEHGAAPIYFEAAAVIVTLVLIGQILELRARAKAGDSLRALLDLAPKTARRIAADGSESEIPVEALKPGDKLRLLPGQSAPVDGIVIEGESALDESLLTGEAIPVAKKPGDPIIGGTLNQEGSLVVEAKKLGSETMLARIVAMVAEAQRSRAPVQRLADKVSAWFVPAVIALAVGAFLAWFLFGPEPRFASALTAAVTVLIVACPCALGLATPMSIMVGVGRGAQMGLLFRDAEALERLEKADALILDKTGTLTEGRPRLVGSAFAEGFESADVLRLAAAVERGSAHPLARAIVAAAEDQTIPMARAVRSVTAKGVIGRAENKEVRVGTVEFLQEGGMEAAPFAAQAEAWRKDGASVVFVGVGGRLAGALALADPIRASTPAALEALRGEGLRAVVASGDHPAAVQALAAKLGLKEAQGGVTPEGKAALAAKLKAEGHRVAMIGDGVNDAPALAAADVGIAMGSGADAARESAGIALLRDDLRGVLAARRLSAATMRNIRQNLTFAFIYNAIGAPLAAGILYPFTGWLPSPALAATAMALSSVSVIANALRLRNFDPKL